jgi:hypothetical protein
MTGWKRRSLASGLLTTVLAGVACSGAPAAEARSADAIKVYVTDILEVAFTALDQYEDKQLAFAQTRRDIELVPFDPDVAAKRMEAAATATAIADRDEAVLESGCEEVMHRLTVLDFEAGHVAYAPSESERKNLVTYGIEYEIGVGA